MDEPDFWEQPAYLYVVVPAESAQFAAVRIDGDMSRRLNRVGMEHHAPFAADRADFSYRQNGSHLVVCVHNGYKRGVGANGLLHLSRGYKSVFIDGEICYRKPFAFKLF